MQTCRSLVRFGIIGWIFGWALDCVSWISGTRVHIPVNGDAFAHMLTWNFTAPLSHVTALSPICRETDPPPSLMDDSQKLTNTTSWCAQCFWLSHRWTPALETHCIPKGTRSNTPNPHCYPLLLIHTHMQRHKKQRMGWQLNTNFGPIYISSCSPVSASLFQGESGELSRTCSSRPALAFYSWL